MCHRQCRCDISRLHTTFHEFTTSSPPFYSTDENGQPLTRWIAGRRLITRFSLHDTAPSAAAYALYGWALAHRYTAEAGTVEAAVPLPDPRLPPAAPPPTARDTPPHRVAARAIAARAAALGARM